MEEAQILIELKNHYKIQFIKLLYPNLNHDVIKQIIMNKLYIVCIPYDLNGQTHWGFATSSDKKKMDRAFDEFFIYERGIYLNRLI